MEPTKFNGVLAFALVLVGAGGTSMTGGQHAIGATCWRFARTAICRAGSLTIVLALTGIGSAQMVPVSGIPSRGSESPTIGVSDSDATSSRSARDEAVRQIPWKQMSPAGRNTAQFIVKNASIYRRLPTRIIDCDPDLFTFLLQHPEVVIDVWHTMGITQVRLNKSPDGVYRGTDGAGTNGSVRYLFSNWGPNAQNLAVVYAEGAYTGAPFVTPLKAQSIMLVRSSAVQETNGRHYITVRIDSFVRVEQLGVEVIAKTVQPWINKATDQNVIETMTFVSNFSRTAEKNPQGMQRLAKRLNAVDEPTRNQLISLCYRTAERYAQRDTATRTSEVLAHGPQFVMNER